MDLKFKVNKQILTRTDRENPVENSKQYLYIEFEFSSEWDKAAKKNVYFSNDNKSWYVVQNIENNRCAVPMEVIKYPTLSLYLTGLNADDTLVITTNIYKNVFIARTGDQSAETSAIKNVESNTLDHRIDGNTLYIEIPSNYLTDENIQDYIQQYLEAKLDKDTSTSEYKRAYTIEKDGTNTTTNIDEQASANTLAMRDSKGNVKTNSAVEQTDAINKSDLENATKNLAKKSDVQNLTDSLNQVKEYIPQETSKENPLVNQNGLEEKLNGYASKSEYENLVKVMPTSLALNENNELYLEHDGKEISGQAKKPQVVIPSELLKYTPVTDFNALDTRVANVEKLVPSNANETNKLVAMSELSFYTPLSNFNNLKALIPTEASTDNLLADRSWVISQIGTVYRYKGSVKNYSDLPTNANNGDVYNVENAYLQYPAGTNYAWNDTTWDALGGSIDLSNYVTQTSLTETLKAYATITYITQTLANYVTSTNLTNILSGYVTTTAFNNHINNKLNPHEVTKDQVGLGNVDNTSDKNKPVSTAQQIAIDGTGHTLNIANNKIQLVDAKGTVLSQVDLPEGGKIDTISVNGVEQPITNKNVNIVTPVIEILESED